MEYKYPYHEREKPGSTSTPKHVLISSRKPIHPNTPVSPIDGTSRNNHISPFLPERHQRAQSEVHSDKDQSDDSCDDCSNEEDGSPKSCSYKSSSKSYSYDTSSYVSNNQTRDKTIRRTADEIRHNTSNRSKLNLIFGCLVLALSVIIVVFGLNMPSEDTITTANIITIKELKDDFPKQSVDVWSALETGIAEIKSFNKPSVFLLLYEKDAEQILSVMLKKVSKYAACILKENCEIEPIMLNRAILGSETVGSDYGYVIEKYKPELQEKGIMIIKNVDKIPGEIAQAFHSMCDEYTPLVPRAVFFFTIKIENLHRSGKSDLQVAEEILRNNWSSLDDDIFYPLFTRISNMVLRIVPEVT